MVRGARGRAADAADAAAAAAAAAATVPSVDMQARAVACVPYLLPMLDALVLLRPGAEAYLPEPLWAAVAPLCGVASVFEHAQGLPLIWFLGVTLLSKNMNAPLLQRYNAKQAQLLDVVTFVPRIAIAVIAAAGLSPGHYDAAFSGIFSVG